jgi:hypothetical protein
MIKNGGVEGRKYKRFQAKKGAFATIWPNYTKEGPIIDISEGGLAFCHSVEKDSTNGSKEVDIFWYDKSFYLDSIPCKIVYEVEIENKALSVPERMRRIGLKFIGISPGKLSRLNYFLKNYTIIGN